MPLETVDYTDSASGSLIQTRDPKKHAIMSLRGKPINVMKHELTKVLKNQEIQDMIIALGGFGEDFKASKLAYDKIIIASDADRIAVRKCFSLN